MRIIPLILYESNMLPKVTNQRGRIREQKLVINKDEYFITFAQLVWRKLQFNAGFERHTL